MIAVRDNPLCTDNMRNGFQPLGIFAAGESLAIAQSCVKDTSGFVRGSAHRVTKSLSKLACYVPEDPQMIVFSEAEMDSLCREYQPRKVSREAKVASKDASVSGTVIGRYDNGDYLIEILTSPFTPAKFRWVPRKLMMGQQFAMKARVDFKAGMKETVRARRSSSIG